MFFFPSLASVLNNVSAIFSSAPTAVSPPFPLGARVSRPHGTALGFFSQQKIPSDDTLQCGVLEEIYVFS